MTIFQTEFSKRRKSTPDSFQHAGLVAVQATVDFSAGAVVGDIADMLTLPADFRVFDWYVDSDANLATTTFDIGFMSGNPGSTDTGRTCGAELAAGASLATGSTAIVRAVLPGGLNSAVSTSGRSIGVKVVTADIAAGANKKVNLTLLIAP